MSTRCIVLTALALACSGGGDPTSETTPAPTPSADGVRLAIAASGEVQAELEPCG